LAQTPDADQRVLQTLLSEVQQLRIAIERQTLLVCRFRSLYTKFLAVSPGFPRSLSRETSEMATTNLQHLPLNKCTIQA
jgi:hypothetical protein